MNYRGRRRSLAESIFKHSLFYRLANRLISHLRHMELNCNLTELQLLEMAVFQRLFFCRTGVGRAICLLLSTASRSSWFSSVFLCSSACRCLLFSTAAPRSDTSTG